MLKTFTLLFLLLLFNSIRLVGQTYPMAAIPSFTAYASPTEDGVRISKSGVVRWNSAQTSIVFWFQLHSTGSLNLVLKVGPLVPASTYQVKIADQKFDLKLNGQPADSLRIGTLQINQPGYYSLEIKPVSSESGQFMDIQSLVLSGQAAQGVHFNSESRRNASSVHLSYPVAKDKKVEWFYNEVSVPAGFDPINSYYMACGFARGYFGIQVNSPTERRVIFSIWDSGNEAVDRSKVNAEDRVRLVKKGKEVFSGDFGNEGTGGHSHLIWNWQTSKTYRFLVHALPDSTNTTYSGYFFDPDQKEWRLISSWKTPKDGQYLSHLYSFIENFDGKNGQLERKAFFSNQWIRTAEGEWIELTKASFTHDPTGKVMRLDYGAGVVPSGFLLWNGGFKEATAKYGQVFERPNTSQPPVIDFSKLP